MGTFGPGAPGPARPALARLAVVIVAAAIATAGLAVMLHAPATEAKLFPASVIDLVLTGPKGVRGFLGGDNFAPGDRASGTLVLYAENAGDGQAFDLDLVVRLSGPMSLADRLHVISLRYAGEDILDGPKHSLLKKLGGIDGRLSISEMRTPALDLPAPLPRAGGGSAFEIQVELDRSLTDQISGTLATEFVFQLGDSLAPDLG